MITELGDYDTPTAIVVFRPLAPLVAHQRNPQIKAHGKRRERRRGVRGAVPPRAPGERKSVQDIVAADGRAARVCKRSPQAAGIAAI